VFFNKQVSLFSDSLNFGFFNLFDGIRFSVFFGSCLEDFREISSSQMNKFSELIKTIEWILGLLFCCCGCLDCSFLRFRVAILFGLGAIDFMCGPMFFLAFDTAVVNLFASGTSEELFIGLIAGLAVFDGFSLGWLLSGKIGGLNLFHLIDYNLKNLK
jgi:hypothetical protein